MWVEVRPDPDEEVALDRVLFAVDYPYQRNAEAVAFIDAVDLDDEDRELIEDVLAPGPAGPVYGLERDRSGRHGRIMKYNLNNRPDDRVLGAADA